MGTLVGPHNERGFPYSGVSEDELFPERWFDLIVCLRCDNSNLYNRLKERNYNDSKIENNIQSEIFGILAEEAKESYASKTVIELPSNTLEDMESNMENLVRWI